MHWKGEKTFTYKEYKSFLFFLLEVLLSTVWVFLLFMKAMFFWLGIEGELALAHDAVSCGELSACAQNMVLTQQALHLNLISSK